MRAGRRRLRPAADDVSALDPAGHAGVRTEPRTEPLAIVVIAGVAATFAIAGLVYVARPWPTVGDWAVAELIVRHLVSDPPLSGAYSADRGFNHPLPYMYLLEWLPYQLSGQRSGAAAATQLWWSGAWCAFILWFCARRRALLLGLLAVAGLLVMASRIEGAVLILPWNPNFAIAPGLALVLVAWRIVAGEYALLPLATAIALWCVGAHLVFLHLAALLGLVIVASMVGRHLRPTRGPTTPEGPGADRSRAGFGRPLVYALVVFVVMVSPMAVDWIRHGDESNPARLVEHLVPEGGQSIAGYDVAAVIRGDLAITPAWSQSRLPYSAYLLPPPDWQPLVLVPMTLALVLAWRRRAGDEAAGIALAFIAVLVCGLGLATLDAPALTTWYLSAIHVASIALYAFVIWSLARSAVVVPAVGRLVAQPGLHTRGVAVALGVVLVAGCVLAVASWRTPRFLARIDATAKQVSDAIRAEYRPGAPVLVSAPITVEGYYSQAVTLDLDRAGIDARVPIEQARVYTSAVAVDPGWTGTEVELVFADTVTAPSPGARLLGQAPVPPEDRWRGRFLQAWRIPGTLSWDGERMRRSGVTLDTGSSQD